MTLQQDCLQLFAERLRIWLRAATDAFNAQSCPNPVEFQEKVVERVGWETVPGSGGLFKRTF